MRITKPVKIVSEDGVRLLRGLSLPLVLGNDLCHIPRISRIMCHSPEKAASFVRRVLTKNEILHPRMRTSIVDLLRMSPSPFRNEIWQDGKQSGGEFNGQSSGTSTGVSDLDEWWKRNSHGAAIFMAGRWAAKEAIIKAHPFRRLTFQDIMIFSAIRERDDGKGGFQETATTKANPDEARSFATEQQMAEEEKDDYGHLEEGSGYVDRDNGSGFPVAVVKAPPDSKQQDECVQVSISHDGDYASAVCVATLHDQNHLKLRDLCKRTWRAGYMHIPEWKEAVRRERQRREMKARRKEKVAKEKYGFLENARSMREEVDAFVESSGREKKKEW